MSRRIRREAKFKPKKHEIRIMEAVKRHHSLSTKNKLEGIDIEKEFKLIQEKKSIFSRTIRDLIILKKQDVLLIK